MSRCFGCSSGGFGSPVFAALSRAAAKSAAARLRGLGVLRTADRWAARLAVCQGCPLRTVAAGIPHCGKPLLRQVTRPPAAGCGCPLEAKARSPEEHCPLAPTGRPRREPRGTGPAAAAARCDCKWCTAEAGKSATTSVAGEAPHSTPTGRLNHNRGRKP